MDKRLIHIFEGVRGAKGRGLGDEECLRLAVSMDL